MFQKYFPSLQTKHLQLNKSINEKNVRFIHKVISFLLKEKKKQIIRRSRVQACETVLSTSTPYTSSSNRISSCFPPSTALFFPRTLFVGRVFFLAFPPSFPFYICCSPSCHSSLPPFLLKEKKTRIDAFTLARLLDVPPGV